MLQVEWDKFSVGISYDVTLSLLTKATQGRGGTEISHYAILPFKQKNRIVCYKIFILNVGRFVPICIDIYSA